LGAHFCASCAFGLYALASVRKAILTQLAVSEYIPGIKIFKKYRRGVLTMITLCVIISHRRITYMAMEFITVRADSETVKTFDEEAKTLGMSRSELLRELMIAVRDCRGILSAKKMERLPAFKKLEDNAAEWLIDNMPDSLSPDMLYVLGGVFHNLANDMMKIRESDKPMTGRKEIEKTLNNLGSAL
jgi:hypothetical protein